MFANTVSRIFVYESYIFDRGQKFRTAKVHYFRAKQNARITEQTSPFLGVSIDCQSTTTKLYVRCKRDEIRMPMKIDRSRTLSSTLDYRKRALIRRIVGKQKLDFTREVKRSAARRLTRRWRNRRRTFSASTRVERPINTETSERGRERKGRYVPI